MSLDRFHFRVNLVLLSYGIDKVPIDCIAHASWATIAPKIPIETISRRFRDISKSNETSLDPFRDTFISKTFRYVSKLFRNISLDDL